MNTTTPPTSQPVLEMSGVSVGSTEDSSVPVLENVNWTVSAGEYWVIGGMHGSGKSALLTIAAGLAAPLAGECRIFGRPLEFGNDALLPERLRMGLVFQDGQLFQRLSVAENVALPLQYHRKLSQAEIGSKVGEILERMDLTRFAAAPAGTLSRNWRKRAGLARALALEPELLFLDDPLGSLDLRHAQWWLKFLAELAEKSRAGNAQMTFIATTGDLRPWQDRGTHFAILQQGHMTVLGHRPCLSEINDPLVSELMGAVEL